MGLRFHSSARSTLRSGSGAFPLANAVHPEQVPWEMIKENRPSRFPRASWFERIEIHLDRLCTGTTDNDTICAPISIEIANRHQLCLVDDIEPAFLSQHIQRLGHIHIHGNATFG